MKRAAIYARYSSDLQKESSIEDQVTACKVIAKRKNLKIVETFFDKAKSGASMFERDGLRDMMTAAKARKFDTLIIEGLDRLSRDQADMHGIYKRLKFWRVTVETVQDGEATAMHFGIRGMTSEMFLGTMGKQVRRGMNGRAQKGLMPSSVAYGYRLVPHKPGEREINREQAKIVVRIFREYAAGTSPRAIAAGLNRDGVQPPRNAKVWNNQTFLGGGNGRRKGIISNRLYIGELVFGTHRVEKDPDTGKVVVSLQDKDTLVEASVPHLRIVDQALWNAAQKVRDQRSIAKFGEKRSYIRKVIPRNNEHILIGLLRCESCGGHMRIRGQAKGGVGLVACAAADSNGTCDHKRSYNIDQLQNAVVQRLQNLLADPESFARMTKGMRDAIEKGMRSASPDLGDVRKQLDKVNVQIDRVVNAIATIDRPVKELTNKLDALEHERAVLAERLRLLEAEANVVKLHPRMLDGYLDNVKKLLTSMTVGESNQEARAIFNMLFDSVVVHRTAKRMPYEITPYGRIGGTMDLKVEPKRRSAKQILEEEGVLNCYNANKAKPKAALQQQVICLGRWKQAA